MNKLPFLSDFPVILQAFDFLQQFTAEVNQQTKNYENWQIILFTVLITYLVMLFLNLYNELDNGIIGYLKDSIFRMAKLFPFLNAKIMKELEKTKHALNEDIKKANKGNLYLKSLPEKGYDKKKLFNTIDKYLELEEHKWETGSLSGCVYGADDNLTEISTKVYERFAWSNPLHADVFPDVRKMEAEVVRWVLNLFNGDEKTCGTMTSGGTESIMLACKAYRDLAYNKGIKKPEMVIPITAHAAFDKAGHSFKIKVRHVPVDPSTGKVDPRNMKSYINSNTCMVFFFSLQLMFYFKFFKKVLHHR